ncbi:MAG: hypothetical protein IJZ25_03415 [Lachnospiraceae bacterium]|nr:hypothetical protein [Lachnospiraceae bacterium]
MKQRLKQLMSMILMALLISQVPVTVLAEVITINVETIISENSSDDYVVESGGYLIVDGASISGDISLGYASMEVLSDGVVTGNITQSGATITINGTVTSDLSLDAANFYAGTGAKFGKLDMTGAYSVNTSGQITVNDLTYYTDAQFEGAENTTYVISDSLSIKGGSQLESVPAFVVEKDTKITKTTTENAANRISVECDGVEYPLPTGTISNKSLNDLYKYSVSTKSVTFPGTAVGYGSVSTKQVIVTNSGVCDLILTFSKSSYVYNSFSVTYGGSAVSSLSSVTLKAGEKVTVNVTPKSGLGVGTYSGSFKITLSTGSGDTISSETVSTSFNVSKKQGSGTINVPSIYYGATVKPVISSATNGTSGAVIEYKPHSQPDSSFSTVVPSAVGNYVARVTFPANATYSSAYANVEFSISYLPAPNSPYSITGTEGENNYYVSDITLKPADGYLVAENLDGNYTDEIIYNENIQDTYIYLKKISTGEKTAGVPVTDILVDFEKPEVEGISDGETYFSDLYTVVIQDDTLYQVTVNGEDAEVTDNSATLELNPESGMMEYIIEVTDMAGNSTVKTIKVAAEWMSTGIITAGKSLKLYTDMKYTFAEGNWKVSGDETCYMGGNSFYVSDNGEFTFQQVE